METLCAKQRHTWLMMLWFQWDERRLEIAGVGCTPVPFSPFFWPPSTCKFYTFKFNLFFFSHTDLLFFCQCQQIWTVTMEDLINNFTVTYRETLALGGECPVSVTLTLALRLNTKTNSSITPFTGGCLQKGGGTTRYLFHLRVIAVACKRPRSFRQKCGWQVMHS